MGLLFVSKPDVNLMSSIMYPYLSKKKKSTCRIFCNRNIYVDVLYFMKKSVDLFIY